MNKEILKKTSLDTGYDLDTVDHVNRFIWKYLKELMGIGKFEGLMLKGFGTFGVNQFSKKRIVEKFKDDWRPAEYAKEKRERNRERLAIRKAEQSLDKSGIEGSAEQV